MLQFPPQKSSFLSFDTLHHSHPPSQPLGWEHFSLAGASRQTPVLWGRHTPLARQYANYTKEYQFYKNELEDQSLIYHFFPTPSLSSFLQTDDWMKEHSGISTE